MSVALGQWQQPQCSATTAHTAAGVITGSVWKGRQGYWRDGVGVHVDYTPRAGGQVRGGGKLGTIKPRNWAVPAMFEPRKGHSLLVGRSRNAS